MEAVVMAVMLTAQTLFGTSASITPTTSGSTVSSTSVIAVTDTAEMN